MFTLYNPKRGHTQYDEEAKMWADLKTRLEKYEEELATFEELDKTEKKLEKEKNKLKKIKHQRYFLLKQKVIEKLQKDKLSLEEIRRLAKAIAMIYGFDPNIPVTDAIITWNKKNKSIRM